MVGKSGEPALCFLHKSGREQEQLYDYGRSRPVSSQSGGKESYKSQSLSYESGASTMNAPFGNQALSLAEAIAGPSVEAQPPVPLAGPK